MRWSIVKLILGRELRDQLRDRRTIFMIVVLPMLLYPILAGLSLHFALGEDHRPSVIGLAGAQHLRGAPAPLLIGREFSRSLFESTAEAHNLRLVILDDNSTLPLDSKQVDLVLEVPPEFTARLVREGTGTLYLSHRDKDDTSRLAAQRLLDVLGRWKQKLRMARLESRQLPGTLLEPFEIRRKQPSPPAAELAAEGFLELMVRVFPFLLVLWSLAGALYPAVDLCAGEKERGTMETLLISPASREEIVVGKFLTIWIFSATSSLLNLAGMGVTAVFYAGLLPRDALNPVAIFWSVLLVLPLAAFFSAVCLSVGIYARSTKEGQYYLMPLFLVTLPLVFLTFVPGVELNPLYSLVPVTGVALLMQKLMNSPLSQAPWSYFLPVLVTMAVYSALALRWAVEQFHREEVLFREAERWDLALWLRRLLRGKEAMPSTGQAIACFAIMVACRWLLPGPSGREPLISTMAITYLACVAAPPLIMALVLTTRPHAGLAMRVPHWLDLLWAGLLAMLVLPPLVQLTLAVLNRFPHLMDLLRQRQPLVSELGSALLGDTPGWYFVIVFAFMPALFEELAFRGFILSGLRHRLGIRTAIIVSSLLFALYHLNVFQAVPALLLGIVLAVLTVRSRSILPGMAFHFLYNLTLIGVPLLPQLGYETETVPFPGLFHPATAVVFAVLAAIVLWLLGRRLEASPIPEETARTVDQVANAPFSGQAAAAGIRQ